MRKPKGTKEVTKHGIVFEHVGDVELSPEHEARLDEAIRIADEEDAVCRVNFRWEAQPLSLVKAVARRIGIPYQTYIKMVLYKQAMTDWQTMQHVPGQPPTEKKSTSKKKVPPKKLSY